MAAHRALSRSQVGVELPGGMDDSGLFMEWAMDALQQYDHPPSGAGYQYHHDCGGDVFPLLKELRNSASQNGATMEDIAAQDGHRHHRSTDSWSSDGDADRGGGSGNGTTSAVVIEQHDGWSSNSVQCAPSSSVGSTTSSRPVSWNFTSAVVQPSNETTPTNQNPNPVTTPWRACDGNGVPYGSPRASAKSGAAASTGHASPPKPYVQDHIMAERQRREKINRRFIELSTVIPGLKKMDKATILSDAVRYVKEQQKKLKALEDRNDGRAIDSGRLVKKPCIARAAAPDGGGGGGTSPSAAGATRNGDALPEIEVRISESDGSVMVRIHCENGKGLLVGMLAEVERLHLTITSTTVVPFPTCTIIITVMAKAEEGFNITAEGIVRRLNSALLKRTSRGCPGDEEPREAT